MRQIDFRRAALLILPAMLAIGAAAQAGRIAAVRPLAPLEAASLRIVPDEVGDEVGPFLERRDSVNIVLERSMPVGELLDLYRIDFRHMLPQIAAQTYPPARSAESVLDSGTLLRLSLTRPDTAIP